MKQSYLNWENIGWQEFQALSVELAETLYPDCNFTEHLKQGQKQDGIDIIGFSQRAAKFYCIQCKRKDIQSQKEIEKIVLEFKQGRYFKNSSKFIIVTSASLQRENTQLFIHNQQVELERDFKLHFSCWDKEFLETQLSKRFDIVCKYFGLQQAKDFCLPQVRRERFKKISPTPNFIPRKLIKYSNDSGEQISTRSFSTTTTFALEHLLVNEQLGTKRICIVGDAHEGKTSYIKETLSQIQIRLKKTKPIFLQLRDYNIQPISSLLSVIYGEWRILPQRDIVLVIDGLDEVPTEKFDEALKYVKEFALDYCTVSIVLSCRKIFFTKYRVGDSLSEFTNYELLRLSYNDIVRYIDSTLHEKAKWFIRNSNTTGITELLYHPFYLVNIIKFFQETPNKLPEGKIQIVNAIIERSFDITKFRKIKGGEFIKDDEFRFKRVIEKFAFALQLGGVNSFSIKEMSQLFNLDERLLLQHNSLITNTGANWAFVNAFFQEHIAAGLLSRMSIDTILRYSFLGQNIKKVKTKWIQTISSLLSMIPQKDERSIKLIELIEADNIELIFQTERSKYSESQKLSFLQKLISRSIKFQHTTQIVYNDHIGNFIQDSQTCKSYLLSLLIDGNQTINVKAFCCGILAYSKLNAQQLTRYIEFFENEIKVTDNQWYGGRILEVLTNHSFGDIKLLERLTYNERLNASHEYRDKVYCLIIELNLVDHFYKYGIEGLEFLIKHNSEISYGGSNYNLETFLVASDSPRNLVGAIKQIASYDYDNYHLRYRLTNRDFLNRLFSKLSSKFDRNPLMIFKIADLIVDLGKKFLRDEFEQLDQFLDETNTHWIILRILFEKIQKDRSWELGALITHECYDFILFEYEDKELSKEFLWTCVRGLRYKHKQEIANKFYNLCLDVTEGTLIDKEDSKRSIIENEAQRIRLKNDLKVIRSIAFFRKGLVRYFEAFGRKKMGQSDLFFDLESRNGTIRKTADSYFLMNFLLRWQEQEKQLHLQRCLMQLVRPGFFEVFQVEEILQYSYHTSESDKTLIPIIRRYYFKYLNGANFVNCMWVDGQRAYWRTNEIRIVNIFKRYLFDTDEDKLIDFVWTDTEGWGEVEQFGFKNRKSLSQIILEKLSDLGREKFKNRIVENLKRGILHESILRAHILLCTRLSLFSSIDTLLQIQQNLELDSSIKGAALDSYIKLGGDVYHIVELLGECSNYNDYFFELLVIRVYGSFPERTAFKLREAINHPLIDEVKRIRYAQILCHLGDRESFNILVEKVKGTKKAPFQIQGEFSIKNIETDFALEKIADVICLVVDSSVENVSFQDSAKNIILEWLNCLASKSEYDLIKVLNFLEHYFVEFQDKYKGFRDLHWYSNRMLENFRGSEVTIKSIEEIQEIISEF